MCDHNCNTAVASAVRSGFLADTSRKNALRTAHTIAKRTRAFTLAELLVTMGVLVLLVLFASQLFKSTATVTTLGHKQMDADAQARQLLDRMAIDFAQMVKRTDLDFFAKGTVAPNSVGGPMTGNDQLAFYSAVPGYYPSSGSQSPVSLVAYRENAKNKLERLGVGLVWNGVSVNDTPVVFMPLTISATWPSATNLAAAPTPEPRAEVIGSQVFRFEYCYLLRTNGSLSITPPVDLNLHDDISQIAGIVVDIAVIDPKSKQLLNDAQIATLAGQLVDYAANNVAPGVLRNSWQDTLTANTTLPRAAISGVRLYERVFYLSPPTL